MLKLDEKQIKVIRDWLRYVETTHNETDANKIKAELFDILINEKTLYKNSLKTETEMWFFSSGLYQEIKTKRNRAERNKRYYEKKI